MTFAFVFFFSINALAKSFDFCSAELYRPPAAELVFACPERYQNQVRLAHDWFKRWTKTDAITQQDCLTLTAKYKAYLTRAKLLRACAAWINYNSDCGKDLLLLKKQIREENFASAAVGRNEKTVKDAHLALIEDIRKSTLYPPLDIDPLKCRGAHSEASKTLESVRFALQKALQKFRDLNDVTEKKWQEVNPRLLEKGAAPGWSEKSPLPPSSKILSH